jgi:hypothetical protein
MDALADIRPTGRGTRPACRSSIRCDLRQISLIAGPGAIFPAVRACARGHGQMSDTPRPEIAKRFHGPFTKIEASGMPKRICGADLGASMRVLGYVVRSRTLRSVAANMRCKALRSRPLAGRGAVRCMVGCRPAPNRPRAGRGLAQRLGHAGRPTARRRALIENNEDQWKFRPRQLPEKSNG